MRSRRCDSFYKIYSKNNISSYIDFEDRVDYVDEKLPSIELVRKAVNKKLGKFTKSDIMELVPSIGKATVENMLKKLVEEGYINRYGKGRSTYYVKNKLNLTSRLICTFYTGKSKKS